MEMNWDGRVGDGGDVELGPSLNGDCILLSLWEWTVVNIKVDIA